MHEYYLMSNQHDRIQWFFCESNHFARFYIYKSQTNHSSSSQFYSSISFLFVVKSANKSLWIIIQCLKSVNNMRTIITIHLYFALSEILFHVYHELQRTFVTSKERREEEKKTHDAKYKKFVFEAVERCWIKRWNKF